MEKQAQKRTLGEKVEGEYFVDGGAEAGLGLEQLGDEVARRAAHLGGDVVLVGLDALVGLLERLRLEGRLADEQREQDAAQGPGVHLVAVALLVQHLGRDVVRRAAQRSAGK